MREQLRRQMTARVSLDGSAPWGEEELEEETVDQVQQVSWFQWLCSTTLSEGWLSCPPGSGG